MIVPVGPWLINFRGSIHRCLNASGWLWKTPYAIGYFGASEKPNERAAQEKRQQGAQNEPEKGQQEAQNELKRAAIEAEQRNRCLAEQERWSIVSASQIEISDASLTGIGNNDYKHQRGRQE